MRLHAPRFWESSNFISWLWLPLAGIYGLITWLRVLAYQLGFFSSSTLPVPLIIVGNIRIGGTGKTPIVIALAKALQASGFRPGVIARAYRAQSDQNQISQEVLPTHSAQEVGDEPALVAQQLARLEIPIWVGKNRAGTALALLKAHPECNVIISDDGLQHYALSRKPAREGGHDIEIIVQDARGIGNGFLLPAGPLRELGSRPRDLTLQLTQQASQQFDGEPYSGNFTAVFDTKLPQLIATRMGLAYPLQSDSRNPSSINRPPQSLAQLASWMNSQHADQRVAALAGIAFPDKFFTPLKTFFPNLKTLALPDHADFSSNPFSQFPTNIYSLILITEKDAVKCQSWLDSRVWVVPLEATISEQLLTWMRTILHRGAQLPLEKE
jgi:tetraacyldisaccharide 4'-kinase